MPNRIIYQVEALYAGPCPATGYQQYITGTAGSYVLVNPRVKNLIRVQSANYGYTLNRRDVNQYGELAAIDRVSLEPPTVNLDFTYLVNSLYNEKALGFYVSDATNTSVLTALKGMLDKTDDERNFWILTSPEGQDANQYGVSTVASTGWGQGTVLMGLGNGFVSNYTVEAAVGDFPRATVTVEAMNITFSSGLPWAERTGTVTTGIALKSVTGIANPSIPTLLFGVDTIQRYAPAVRQGTGTAIYAETPAVNPADGQPVTGPAQFVLVPPARSHGGPDVADDVRDNVLSVLRPGDITMDVYAATTQTALDEIGAKITDAKLQSFNLSVGLTREPLNKLGTKYSFARELSFPITVTLRADGNVGDVAFANLGTVINANRTYDCVIKMKNPSGQLQAVYSLRGATLDSQSYTSSIGPSKAVSYTWNTQVSGPQQTTIGLFMSGIVTGNAGTYTNEIAIG